MRLIGGLGKGASFMPAMQVRSKGSRRRPAVGPALGVIGLLLALALPAQASARVPGSELWAARFRGGNLASEAYAVATSPDGARVYVAGVNAVVAYAAGSGDLLWDERYSGTVYAMGVAPNGRVVFVTGTATASSGDFGDYGTVAYDAFTGEVQWRATYDAGTRDYACCLKVSADGGRVYVTGESWGPTYFDYATVSYDALTGQEIWTSRYDGIASGYDDPHGMVLSPDGHLVFVTGESPGEPAYNDYATIAYDANTGQQMWLQRLDTGGGRGDTAYAIAASPDGTKVFVTGCTGDFDYCVNADFLTVAYDASNGDPAWTATSDGPGHGYDAAGEIGVSADSDVVYVAGTGDGGTSLDDEVVAYRTDDGSRIWGATFDGERASEDVVDGMVVLPDGSAVVVTGESSITWAATDYETVSFDAGTGAQLWAARYSGPQGKFDVAYAVASGPDSGAVYVTGTSVADNYEFATVAYQT
jgi:hypothetical protein